METGLDKKGCELRQGAHDWPGGWEFDSFTKGEEKCQCGIPEQASLRGKKLWLKNRVFEVKISDMLQLLLLTRSRE